jgi:dolichyl-phosphate beta-glucosyltransferase
LGFPSLLESPCLELSVIIPAYNEETRLPVMLDESVDYLAKHFDNKFEIIVVDDGSKDKTTPVALVITYFSPESFYILLRLNYD